MQAEELFNLVPHIESVYLVSCVPNPIKEWIETISGWILADGRSSLLFHAEEYSSIDSDELAQEILSNNCDSEKRYECGLSSEDSVELGLTDDFLDDLQDPSFHNSNAPNLVIIARDDVIRHIAEALLERCNSEQISMGSLVTITRQKNEDGNVEVSYAIRSPKPPISTLTDEELWKIRHGEEEEAS